MDTILQEVIELILKGYIIPEDVFVLEEEEIKVPDSKGLQVEDWDYYYSVFHYQGVKFVLLSEDHLDKSSQWDIGYGAFG